MVGKQTQGVPPLLRGKKKTEYCEETLLQSLKVDRMEVGIGSGF